MTLTSDSLARRTSLTVAALAAVVCGFVNAQVWVQHAAAVSPSTRAAQAMAFDSLRGRVVLFGGWNGIELGDTWEWDGGTWQQRSTPTAPAARGGAGMAYDPFRGRAVLFGGTTGATDTWE